jgi:hypothetical protein
LYCRLNLPDEIGIADVGGPNPLALPLKQVVKRKQQEPYDDPDGEMTKIDHKSLS